MARGKVIRAVPDVKSLAAEDSVAFPFPPYTNASPGAFPTHNGGLL